MVRWGYDMRLTFITLALLTLLALGAAPIATGQSASLPEPGQIIFAGDSLSAANNPVKYPYQLMALLPGGWTWSSVAVPGQGSAGMLSGATDTAALLDRSRPTNLVSVWVGTNDGTALGLRTYDNVVASCRALRRAGFQVLVLTVLPRSDSFGVEWGQPWVDGRELFNARLRGSWRTFANFFADVAGDPRIGGRGDSDDATYYADGVHLTAAGYAVVAGIAYEALQRPVKHIRRGPRRS
jgi:lysophospholipase L1-like esterase